LADNPLNPSTPQPLTFIDCLPTRQDHLPLRVRLLNRRLTMDQYLPPSGIPCSLQKAGQCPKGDGCEHAHDFIAQPCLSASQIDYRMRFLEDARPADSIERVKNKRKKKQLRRLGARKLAAPSLIERGILPTKKAIRHELGRYTVGLPNNIALPAARRAFVEDGEDDCGEWQTLKLKVERRKRKILVRRNAQAREMSRSLGANVCYLFLLGWIGFLCYSLSNLGLWY